MVFTLHHTLTSFHWSHTTPTESHTEKGIPRELTENKYALVRVEKNPVPPPNRRALVGGPCTIVSQDNIVVSNTHS